jgi:hypothetical protein
MKITDDVERQKWAQDMMAAEKDKVLKAISALQNWNGANLRVSVFSAEGDFFCILLRRYHP